MYWLSIHATELAYALRVSQCSLHAIMPSSLILLRQNAAAMPRYAKCTPSF